MENISSTEMSQFVGRRIRKISPRLQGLADQTQAMPVMQVLVTYLREVCTQRKYQHAYRLLQCVGQLYERGDRAIRQSIDYLFMYSFSRMDHLCSSKEWHNLLSHLPQPLRISYQSQHLK